jgi:hypothetical protein
MGTDTVLYLRIEKMAKSPKAKPNFNCVVLNKKQIKKLTVLNKKKVNKKSLFLCLG